MYNYPITNFERNLAYFFSRNKKELKRVKCAVLPVTRTWNTAKFALIKSHDYYTFLSHF